MTEQAKESAAEVHPSANPPADHATPAAAPGNAARGWRRALASGGRLAAAPLRALAGMLSWKLLLFAALAIAVLQWSGLVFPLFTTRGTIYVDSPEVYTRERLVNDRYDQDWWLREQLKRLDSVFDETSPDSLVPRREQQTGTLTTDASSDAGRSQTSPPADARTTLTFEQRFSIVAGIRDHLRQLLLENMLDDRHDLTGNSVFGLKFDTTVLPGNNTRERAFVDIVLEREDLYASSAEGLPLFLCTYLEHEWERLRQPGGRSAWREPKDWAKRKRDYADQLTDYRAWLQDIENRLNEAEDSLFQSMRGCRPASEPLPYDKPSYYYSLMGRTLTAVLGITTEYFTNLNAGNSSSGERDDRSDEQVVDWRMPTYLKLPVPWSDLMFLRPKLLPLPPQEADEHCMAHVWFDVEDLVESYDARRAGGEGATADGELWLIGETDDGQWELLVDREKIYPTREERFASPLSLRYDLSSPFVYGLSRLHQTRNPNWKPQSPFEIRRLPSGLFNFVTLMANFDAYPYAIFPKNDVVGVFSDVSSQLTGSADGAVAQLLRRVVESRTVSTLIGYGHGQLDTQDRDESPVDTNHRPGSVQNADQTAAANDRALCPGFDIHQQPGAAAGLDRNAADEHAVRFGWVISPLSTTMQPTMKSQLALVSVPAWTDTLRLKVTTGWLGRDGIPVAATKRSFMMEVSVPPDYESFDTIFLEDAGVSRGPNIEEDKMDDPLYVVAGRKERFNVLIVGTRLWRSATVTLGAQTANRIRVLPNMEGIIAEFSDIQAPHGAALADAVAAPAGGAPSSKCLPPRGMANREVHPLKLRVWTSEGVADVVRPVCVIAATEPSAPPSSQPADAASGVPESTAAPPKDP